ncbi:glycerophosphoryl diester phosphodiesterase [Pedobacter immunditicola]|uniref:glycerophosphoryl diester phosphodiesterase n=1 Tax=Pedobacter immunditicola TaxID=3133440 RepID=UPI0030AA54FE
MIPGNSRQIKVGVLGVFLFLYTTIYAQPKAQPLVMNNNQVKIEWEKGAAGWKIKMLSIKRNENWINLSNPSGESTLLYSAEKPSKKSDSVFKTTTGVNFIEPVYKYQINNWNDSTNPVSLNTAGEAYYFYPKNAKRIQNNRISFQEVTDLGIVDTEWSFDSKFPSDIVIKQTLHVKKSGYFSMASPTLAPVSEKDLTWATVPGYFQGNKIEKNFVLAYAYGNGVPNLPVVYRERSASTLSPMISSSNGITVSAIPDPGLARDPYAKDKITHGNWLVGLSHKNRKSELAPTLYYPVLGETNSALKTGDVVSYSFRYSLTDGDWFKALNHAIYDIYKFKEALNMRKNRQSLTSRIEEMHQYLTDPVTSLWNVEEYKNMSIGAQSYLGGVVGSDKDAIKNSDYGAMWMLASMTKDTLLTQQRLPYAMNFKFVQQQNEEGFFKGAAIGQYYLTKSKKFVEEWGAVVEPIGLTYYTMLDIGNILLFEPGNQKLKERLRMGAETLLEWQKSDGSWAVAYDRETEAEIFRELRDLRPTFYGLMVAYQLLGDEKYLVAAQKGADWLIEHAVNTGSFLGVCGDARYAADFATGQTAQAFLDLYELTKQENYKQAAIATARIYTASIYTHPIPSHQKKLVNGVVREDWEIAQSGLSFEHGGILGSSNGAGPILLASHAGLFIRMYEITKDQIFMDMARAAAIGRDAFVDSKTSVASYYWTTMNAGAGPFPHHAWWQIGWITDYIMAEAEMRSNGNIIFPKGFITPKVGPHRTYNFKPGHIFKQAVELKTTENFVHCNLPQVDYFVAKSTDSHKTYLVVLNNQPQVANAKLTWGNHGKTFKKITVMDRNGTSLSKINMQLETALSLEAYGLKILVLE